MNNKSDFEVFGGTYRQVGDYFIPNLKLSDEKEVCIGIWVIRRKSHLMQRKKALFGIMVSEGTLWKYLDET